MTLILATGNPHKAAELQAGLVARVRWRVLARRQAASLREDGATLEANARAKALAAARMTGGWALADDTGLEVDALRGGPGVRSARYAGPRSNASANMRKLLRALRTVAPRRRTARFRCVLILAHPSGVAAMAEGEVAGRIARTRHGRGGFGYDPVFLPSGAGGRSFAQMTPAEKQARSHRGAALRRLDVLLRRLAAQGRR